MALPQYSNSETRPDADIEALQSELGELAEVGALLADAISRSFLGPVSLVIMSISSY